MVATRNTVLFISFFRNFLYGFPCRLLLHLLLKVVVPLFELLVFRFPRPGFEVAVGYGEHKEQHPDQQSHNTFERPDSRPNSFGLLFQCVGKLFRLGIECVCFVTSRLSSNKIVTK